MPLFIDEFLETLIKRAIWWTVPPATSPRVRGEGMPGVAR
jgi:hypothetical protein